MKFDPSENIKATNFVDTRRSFHYKDGLKRIGQKVRGLQEQQSKFFSHTASTVLSDPRSIQNEMFLKRVNGITKSLESLDQKQANKVSVRDQGALSLKQSHLVDKLTYGDFKKLPVKKERKVYKNFNVDYYLRNIGHSKAS